MPHKPVPIVDRPPMADLEPREQLGISVDDLAARAGIPRRN